MQAWSGFIGAVISKWDAAWGRGAKPENETTGSASSVTGVKCMDEQY